MANESQILVEGNFLIVRDITRGDTFVCEPVSDVRYFRNASDDFYFISRGAIGNTDAQQQNNIITGFLGEKRAYHPFAECVDSAGLPFASADALESFLASEIGKSFNTDPVNVIVDGGEINTTSDPLLLTETYRQRVSELFSQLDIKQLHDNQPLFYNVVLGNGGTNTHVPGDASSVMATTSPGDYVIVQSKQRGSYQNGKPMEIIESFIGFETVSGQEIRAGYFTSSTVAPHNTNYDGYFLSSIGGVVSLEVWKSGTQTTIVNQSAWNDPLDGTGSSGKTIDWSKIQFFRSTFLWLGVDGITIYVKIDDVLIPCHKVRYENVATQVFMSSPNQPLRFELRQTGATAKTFSYICTSIGSDGSINRIGKVLSDNAGTNDIQLSSAGTTYAAFGIRQKTTHLDSSIDIIGFDYLAETNDRALWELRLNPTIGAGTFNYTDVANAAVQTSIGNQTAGTPPTASGGTVLDSGYVEQNGSIRAAIDSAIRLGSNIDGTRDEIVLCITPINAGLDAFVSFTWRELT